MSKNVASLIAILALLFTLLMLYILYRRTNLFTGPPPFREALDAFKAAKTFRERIFIAAYSLLPMVIRTGGFWSAFATVATAGFGCIAAIFGFGEEELKVIRDMLRDLYAFIERLVNSKPNNPTLPADQPQSMNQAMIYYPGAKSFNPHSC